MGTRTQLDMTRTEAASGGGMVSAKTPEAAEIGVAVLRSGGNAVDAAVAMSFACGVAEPWMSGIGGGGYMVIKGPGMKPTVVEFPMVAPAGAREDMFPLSGAPADAALFGWPSVVDGANVHGPRSVAVPGTIAGMALASERFGTRPFGDLVMPAADLAARGVPVTWQTTLTMSSDLAGLRLYPETARVYLDPNGLPWVSQDTARPARVRQPDLATTLTLIAEQGPRAFYEGPIAASAVAHLQASGAPHTLADFAGYKAVVSEGLTLDYHGRWVHTIGGASGGTTLVQSLLLMDELGVAGLGLNSPAALHRMAQAFRQAFADRFAWLADSEYVEVPLEVLTDKAYAAEMARAFPADRLTQPTPGPAGRMGVNHGLGGSVPEYGPNSVEQMSDGSTTHYSVIDKDGMAVSVTQTLLALWGSRVTIPGTGMLMNNGMMWFDPVPGRPNSVAGGKRPLSNMAPVVISRIDTGDVVASLGSTGGRKIMNCNTQLVANVIDHRLGIWAAMDAPRIDCSTADLLISERMPAGTIAALRAMGHRTAPRDESLLGRDFASPCAVMRTSDGGTTGAADPYYAMATAIGE